MEINVSRVQNILRTYKHLINPKLEQSKPEVRKTKTIQNELSHPKDRVTISDQSRKRLKEDENINKDNSLQAINEE